MRSGCYRMVIQSRSMSAEAFVILNEGEFAGGMNGNYFEGTYKRTGHRIAAELFGNSQAVSLTGTASGEVARMTGNGEVSVNWTRVSD